MKLLDIHNTITRTLKSNFPDRQIYGEEKKRGATFPCFFAYLITPNKLNETKYLKKRFVGVKITHMLDSGHTDKNKAQYEVIDRLGQVFGDSLVVLYGEGKKHQIEITNLSSRIVEGDLHFSFDLDFYEDIVIEDDSQIDYMGELAINLEES